ncbi:hypothetical protein B0H13DRAFT_2354405 [Mycena leptocephala]|nr:hypothetical protein B0H13DRAFT_2354405 [Mycena leptocephala]
MVPLRCHEGGTRVGWYTDEDDAQVGRSAIKGDVRAWCETNKVLTKAVSIKHDGVWESGAKQRAGWGQGRQMCIAESTQGYASPSATARSATLVSSKLPLVIFHPHQSSSHTPSSRHLPNTPSQNLTTRSRSIASARPIVGNEATEEAQGEGHDDGTGAKHSPTSPHRIASLPSLRSLTYRKRGNTSLLSNLYLCPQPKERVVHLLPLPRVTDICPACIVVPQQHVNPTDADEQRGAAGAA